MRLTVRAHASARVERLVQTGPLEVEAWVRAQAREGRANAALEKMLAEALHVSRSAVRVVRGHTGHRKQIEVEGMDQATLTAAVSRLDARS